MRAPAAAGAAGIAAWQLLMRARSPVPARHCCWAARRNGREKRGPGSQPGRRGCGWGASSCRRPKHSNDHYWLTALPSVSPKPLRPCRPAAAASLHPTSAMQRSAAHGRQPSPSPFRLPPRLLYEGDEGAHGHLLAVDARLAHIALRAKHKGGVAEACRGEGRGASTGVSESGAAGGPTAAAAGGAAAGRLQPTCLPPAGSGRPES